MPSGCSALPKGNSSLLELGVSVSPFERANVEEAAEDFELLVDVDDCEPGTPRRCCGCHAEGIAFDLVAGVGGCACASETEAGGSCERDDAGGLGDIDCKEVAAEEDCCRFARRCASMTRFRSMLLASSLWLAGVCGSGSGDNNAGLIDVSEPYV